MTTEGLHRTKSCILLCKAWGIGAVLVLAASPVLAQTGESSRDRIGLATLLTWMPMLIFLAIVCVFYGNMRKAVSWGKRCEDHMDRVEALLERVAAAVEKE